jgi:hypothetical protein
MLHLVAGFAWVIHKFLRKESKKDTPERMNKEGR